MKFLFMCILLFFLEILLFEKICNLVVQKRENEHIKNITASISILTLPHGMWRRSGSF